MTEKKPRWTREAGVVSASLVVPAVRLVALVAGPLTEDDGSKSVYVDRYIVLALCCRIVREFSKMGGEYRGGGMRGLRAANWHEELPEVEFEGVVIREGRLMGLGDRLHFEDEDIVMIECPWPVEEDDRRLAEHEERLREKVRK